MGIDYLKTSLTPETQLEQADHRQVQNNAGGFVFAVDDWTRLDRFLILGSEGGTYYVREQKLTKDNAKCVERCAQADGLRTVARIVEISESGRAPKNDPAILALAIVTKAGDATARAAAYAAMPRVCRTGTHLYHFIAFVDQLGAAWKRGLKRAVAGWMNRPVDQLAYQLVKYQSRDGWSAKDVLRLAHVQGASSAHADVFRWVLHDEHPDGVILPPVIEAFEQVKRATDLKEVVGLIRTFNLPREAVPTQWLTKPEVWDALLHAGKGMPMTAMIRNLATMTRVGLIAPLSDATMYVAKRLGDEELIHKARIHPMQMLTALKTYAQGHGDRGTSTWKPEQLIVDALDQGFYTAFHNVEPTGKATLLAIDVSGSMDGGTVCGVQGISPRMAAAAMALVTASVEPNRHLLGFSHKLVDLPISPRMRLDKAMEVMARVPMGSTDCAQPFIWASKSNARPEAFAVYTDNETWSGSMHPHVALRNYRQVSGKAARSVVVGMTATQFTIAHPDDPGMLDVVGFDAAAPAIIADFFRGDDGTKTGTIDKGQTGGIEDAE